MVWVVLAAAVAAGVGMAAWLNVRRRDRHRRVQLYLHAVAVALGAWGCDDDDRHRLDVQTHDRCRVAINLAAVGAPWRWHGRSERLAWARGGCR